MAGHSDVRPDEPLSGARTSARALTILAVGGITAASFRSLQPFFVQVEQIDLPVSPGAPLALHKAEINRAIDGAAHSWILLLREREEVSETLAREIDAHAIANPQAWGFRIRSVAFYDGKPLALVPSREGEIRLLHRRHCRFDLRSAAEEPKVEGPVMRLDGELTLVVFPTRAAHRAWLEAHGVPHSLLRRLLLFLAGLWRARGAAFSANSRSYLWLDAAYDQTGERE